ncbi:hypothetical protein JOF53_004815 [Crossiella equi]|uniref:ABC transporter permease n=1 Tax=Crossiella equi TaxID=130796 RepID=A0ABS5AH83_9PSEU|nr:ABC transporter permease [Crossiella equi]MBP2475943.1 hypothetical protein [Crossiella equi]
MTTAFAAPLPRATARPREVDSRGAYLGFAGAYLFGHGASALAKGSDPVLALPGWLPMTLLALGLATGSVLATIAALRAMKGADKAEALSGNLLGASWVVGMGAVFLLITGLHSMEGMPDLQSVLWPSGAGFVVGLIYLAEGAVRRNVLHYVLGTYLALLSTAALFLGTPGMFWLLALAGSGGFVIAAVLEKRRLAI